MDLIEKIKTDLKDTLSEQRYIHSLGVMKRAGELAKIYGVDIKKAEVVGLTHDIAKEMTTAEKIKYTKENNIKIDKIERVNTTLLHGKIGADITKKKYGFTKDMQDAIEYHTTTDPKMDMLAKIIYVADKTEENRKSKKYDINYEKELADKNIDKAILYIINESIRGLIIKNKVIHPKSIETRNYILINTKKLKETISKRNIV